VSFVLDNSVAMAWCFKDEQTSVTCALQERILKESAFVPQHWLLEVTNALLYGVKKKRITDDYRRQQIRILYALKITPDEHTYDAAWSAINELAAKHNLTTYDAAYLELSLRLRLPLATLDEDLRVAAEACGVMLLGK